jgi:ABC-type multidrug transport system ATPase subunit
MRGRTTFIIAHRISSLRDADLILVLDHGQIVQRGAHEELLAQPGIYRRIHDMQARIEVELVEDLETTAMAQSSTVAQSAGLRVETSGQI